MCAASEKRHVAAQYARTEFGLYGVFCCQSTGGAFKVSPKLVPLPAKDHMCCFDSVWCSIVIRMCAVSEKRHVAATCPNRSWLIWCFLLLINWGAFKVSLKLVPLPAKDRMCCFDSVWCSIVMEMTTNDQSLQRNLEPVSLLAVALPSWMQFQSVDGSKSGKCPLGML